MLDLKELLIILGLAAGGPGDLPTIDFYIHELRTQSMNEKKLKEEIKLLEFKKMYDDVDKISYPDLEPVHQPQVQV